MNMSSEVFILALIIAAQFVIITHLLRRLSDTGSLGATQSRKFKETAHISHRGGELPRTDQASS